MDHTGMELIFLAVLNSMSAINGFAPGQDRIGVL